MRDLFPIEMTAHRSRFIAAVIYGIQSIDDNARFNSYFRGLGTSHRKFFVEPQHYALFGEALLEAFRHVGGDRWTVEYDQAWREAFDAAATTMLRGAQEDSGRPPFWHAYVVRHQRCGRDVAVITCQPLVRYEFRAGQYAGVECAYHPRMWRMYSIANAPRPDGTLDFHVRAPSNGWVSAALVRRLAVGDIIKVAPPMGTMTLDRNSPRDVLCIAGGTGLAAIKSIVEDLASFNRTRFAHVFWGVRDRDDFYDLPAMTRLAATYPWLSLIPVCSEDPTYPGQRGNVDEVVRRYGPWTDHDVYVCGPPAMVNATLNTLSGIGVPQHRIRYDAVVGVNASPPSVLARRR